MKTFTSITSILVVLVMMAAALRVVHQSVGCPVPVRHTTAANSGVRYIQVQGNEPFPQPEPVQIQVNPYDVPFIAFVRDIVVFVACMLYC